MALPSAPRLSWTRLGTTPGSKVDAQLPSATAVAAPVYCTQTQEQYQGQD